MRDVALFGAGKVGKLAVARLEKSYRILFVVDNNEAMWGSDCEGYLIKSPMELLQCDCDIIISSVVYRIDILYYLQEIGIERNRIYFLTLACLDDFQPYEVYPIDVQRLKASGKQLIQYDLLNNDEQKTDSIKVLIAYSYYSVYTKQLIENMSKRYGDIEFSLLTGMKVNMDRIDTKYLKHIYYFHTKADLKAILEQLPLYDAMQLLWIEHEWAYFYMLMRNKTKRLNLNVGGSEFYRASRGERDYKRNLIACADIVTAETVGTVKEFQEYYSEEVKNKMGLLPFGVEILDWINANSNLDKNKINKIKEKFHIPLNKIVVTCGHNANAAHQHMDMIDALSNMQDDEKRKIVCVFPMTYNGSEEHISKVRERLSKVDFEYIILTEFMDFQSMAEYALISDIMIHVQTTDQLSSTMLEEMYAGSVVIAGSWLPYKELHEMGIYFIDVDAIPDVTNVLVDVVANIDDYQERCKGNKEIVWNHSSWDALAPKWRALWD